MGIVDEETRFLIRCVASAHLLCGDEDDLIECFFCGADMSQEQVTSASAFQHAPLCPMLRAQAWMRAHAVESVPFVIDATLPGHVIQMGDVTLYNIAEK